MTTETTAAFVERPDLARMAARVHRDAASAEQRWGEVIEADGEAFRRLCAALVDRLGGPLLRPVVRALAELVWRSRPSLPSHLRADCAWLAAHSGGLSSAEFALLQAQYGLVGRIQGLGLLAGCTVSACWPEAGGGWRLLRNLDWGRGRLRAAFAEATRHYLWLGLDGRARAAVVGFPGMLGAVTGVRLAADGRPAWAIALNTAPWRGWAAGSGEEPTLLLARLLDGPAGDWSSAHDELMAARSAAPALITLLGRSREEARVFEFGPGRAPALRRPDAGVLVVTNHFDPTGPFAGRNPSSTHDDAHSDNLLRSSRPRAAALLAAAWAGGSREADDEQRALRLLAAHRAEPVRCVRNVHLLGIDLGLTWPALRVWTPATADPPI